MHTLAMLTNEAIFLLGFFAGSFCTGLAWMLLMRDPDDKKQDK